MLDELREVLGDDIDGLKALMEDFSDMFTDEEHEEIDLEIDDNLFGENSVSESVDELDDIFGDVELTDEDYDDLD